MDLNLKQIENFHSESSFFNDSPTHRLSVQESTDDRISIENLKKLALFSETIEEPDAIGKFNNEAHYLKTLELVLNSTLETSNRLSFFLNTVIPSIPTKNNVLDIGPGDGSLTGVLANHFKKITVVDTNQHILNQLEFPPSATFDKINSSILDIEFTSNSFDLAVLSHILYYVDPAYWANIIKSIYKSLNKNGLLVIVLGGDELGKADLIKHFGGQSLWIDRLAMDCLNEFGANNTHFCASNESFIAYTQQAMFHISAFMLGDANISASKDDLNEYIEQKFQHFDTYFEMTTKQKYIVIRKQ